MATNGSSEGGGIEATVGAIIEKYCNDAAAAILAKADEIMTSAESFHAESLALADNLKKCGELQKERATQVVAIIDNARRTVKAISATVLPATYVPSANPTEIKEVPAGLEAAIMEKQQ